MISLEYPNFLSIFFESCSSWYIESNLLYKDEEQYVVIAGVLKNDFHIHKKGTVIDKAVFNIERLCCKFVTDNDTYYYQLKIIEGSSISAEDYESRLGANLDSKSSFIKSLVFNNEGVVITDPCYICKDNDYEKCEYGQNLSIFGIEAITSSTLYGDWSCTVFSVNNAPNNVVLGNFCADSGLVTVCKLSQVLEYNPDFKSRIDNLKYSVTVIPNFTGVVSILQGKHPHFDDEETSCWVEGHGSIDFISVQTGL